MKGECVQVEDVLIQVEGVKGEGKGEGEGSLAGASVRRKQRSS